MGQKKTWEIWHCRVGELSGTSELDCDNLDATQESQDTATPVGGNVNAKKNTFSPGKRAVLEIAGKQMGPGGKGAYMGRVSWGPGWRRGAKRDQVGETINRFGGRGASNPPSKLGRKSTVSSLEEGGASLIARGKGTQRNQGRRGRLGE